MIQILSLSILSNFGGILKLIFRSSNSIALIDISIIINLLLTIILFLFHNLAG